jgi:DNA invertase Pin-like site-specific DNA recombinase
MIGGPADFIAPCLPTSAPQAFSGTAEQANNGDSPETQRHQITGYAMMKGWEVAEFFIDRGVSGSLPLIERPEGQHLLAAVTAGCRTLDRDTSSLCVMPAMCSI